MSADVKPYTSEDLHDRAVKDVVPPSRLRATVEALERVTKERDEARGRYYDAKNELDAALAACAEMRAALELLANSPEHGEDCDGEECGRCKGTGVLGDMTCDTCGGDTFVLTVQCVAHCAAKESARKTLSSTAGRGWVSPEEHARVVDAFESNSKEASEVFEVLLARGLIPNVKPGPRLAEIVSTMVSPEAFDAALREVADAVALAVRKAKHGGGR